MLQSLVVFIALLLNKYDEITFVGQWRIQYHQPLLQQQHPSQRSGNLICTISPQNYAQFKLLSKQKQTKIRVSNIFQKSEDSFLQQLHHSPNISISQISINDNETKIQKIKIQPPQLSFQVTQNRQVIISHSQYRWVLDKFMMKKNETVSEANIMQYLLEYVYIGLVVIAYIGYRQFERQDYAQRGQIVTAIFWILANYYVQSKDNKFLYLMYAYFGVNLTYFIGNIGKEKKKSGTRKREIINILVILCLFIFMSYSSINAEIIYLLYCAFEIKEAYFIIRDSKNATEIKDIKTHSQSFDLHIQFLLVGYQIYNYLYLSNVSKTLIFVIGSFCIQLLKHHIRKIGVNKIVKIIKSRNQKQKKDENDSEQKPLL